MADQSKLEQMLEKLVNNDREGADQLFHEFVIEKSRGIYEQMLETELKDLEVDEATDEEVDEATDEEVDEATDEEVDENFGEITPEAPEMDATGDLEDEMSDGDDDEMGMGDDDEDEDIEDRVVDLEDALDDLKAEFEKMMSGDSDDSEGDDDAADMDMDDEGDEDKEEAFDVAPELSVEDEAPAFEGTKTAGEQMREYVEKVTPKMGDTGTDGTKSPVAGKNDMGGDAGNIAQGGDEKGGKASAPKEDNAGNVNVPGAKASKSMSANAKGHGAEKKGAGETGTNSKSTIGS